jgi:AAA family ATP:ADP antiporter
MKINSDSDQEFGKLRSFLWPIHAYELKKVLPMLIMFFFITFNYTLLRDTKDTLVITAPGSGAEIIPFIKVWLVVPIAVGLMLIYAKLSNYISRQTLFYVTIAPFLLFFTLFAFILYPARDLLHPTDSADFLQLYLPSGFSGFIALYRNWTFAIFYVLAELWGSVMLSLVFWGFANQITKVKEAKRFYNLFGLGGNTAPFFSGLFMIYINRIDFGLFSATNSFEDTLKILMSTTLLFGVLIMLCYYWICRFVLSDPRFYNPDEVKKQKKEKPKLSLKDSFIFLIKSSYIRYLGLLVICYGIAINLIEVTWKHQLKLLYPNPKDYSQFMGHFSLITGCVSFLMVLFVGGNVIRKFGWLKAARLTPIVLLITGVGFFGFVLFSDTISNYISIGSTGVLMYAVLFGAAQNILSKCTKYSLFDPTKEMAYIPLDDEAKVKGKAAIDIVGSRLGKSGGAVVQQGLLVLFGSIGAITPYIALLLFLVIFVWLYSAKELGKQFSTLTAENEPDENLNTKEAYPAAKRS